MSHSRVCLFSSGLDMANLVVNSDLLHLSWAAITETGPYNSTSPSLLTWKAHQHPSGVTFLAFVTSPDFTVQHLQGEDTDLVSSETLKAEFPLFDFVSTKINPSFSIHRAAIKLYASLHNDLLSYKNLIDSSNSLIITGHSFGGSIAALFTLWLQHTIDLELQPKRPVCITFGSPLVGDDGFQQAISERATWNSSFLNVVLSNDPIPRLFASSHNGSSYKPFGTFVFCSESGSCACFEESESILGILVEMNPKSTGNVQTSDYGMVLEALKKKAICGEISQLGEFNINPLRAGIILQLDAGGIIPTQESNGAGALISRIEAKQARLLMSKRNVYEPTKKLNDMKISMTYMEWYKKAGALQGGYYDCYKNPKNIKEIESQQEIVKHQRMLGQYWRDMAEEKDKMPQKEGAKFRSRWLYGGTNYRRMVEPLDIAEYYHKEGKRGYISNGRSRHYIMLEKWMNEDKNDADKKRTKAASLTEDSCFWAHVEEAIISCKVLKDKDSIPEEKTSAMKSLSVFEEYATDSIKNLLVSAEIFLQGSSFMQWWREYKEIKGASYYTWLTDFMRNHYQAYK